MGLIFFLGIPIFCVFLPFALLLSYCGRKGRRSFRIVSLLFVYVWAVLGLGFLLMTKFGVFSNDLGAFMWFVLVLQLTLLPGGMFLYRRFKGRQPKEGEQ